MKYIIEKVDNIINEKENIIKNENDKENENKNNFMEMIFKYVYDHNYFTILKSLINKFVDSKEITIVDLNYLNSKKQNLLMIMVTNSFKNEEMKQLCIYLFKNKYEMMDLNVKDIFENTLFLYSVMYEIEEIANIILNIPNINILQINDQKYNSLFHMCINNYEHLFIKSIEYCKKYNMKIDYESKNGNGNNLFLLACRFGLENVVNIILKEKDINKKNIVNTKSKLGGNVLLCLAKNNLIEIIERIYHLINDDYDYNSEDEDGFNLFIYVCKYKNENLIEKIIEKNIENKKMFEKKNKSGKSGFYYIIYHKLEDIALKILDIYPYAFLDINFTDDDIFDMACKREMNKVVEKIMRYLRKMNYKIKFEYIKNRQSIYNRTNFELLLYLYYNNYYKTIIYLLNNLKDELECLKIFSKDNVNKTILELSCEDHQLELVEYIFDIIYKNYKTHINYLYKNVIKLDRKDNKKYIDKILNHYNYLEIPEHLINKMLIFSFGK